MRYALIRPDNTIDRFAANVDPTVQTKAGWRWLLALEPTLPSYDTTTQVLEGPVSVVGVTEVTSSYTVRNKTAPELDTEKLNSVNGMELVVLRILFNHENRIRTLASQPSITVDQFKTALKNLL